MFGDLVVCVDVLIALRLFALTCCDAVPVSLAWFVLFYAFVCGLIVLRLRVVCLLIYVCALNFDLFCLFVVGLIAVLMNSGFGLP